jgi:hypothetical protein
LRLKVLATVDLGMPGKEVVRTFGVSMPTIDRYLRLRLRFNSAGSKGCGRLRVGA